MPFFLAEGDDGISGDAWQNGAVEFAGDDFVADDKKALAAPISSMYFFFDSV